MESGQDRTADEAAEVPDSSHFGRSGKSNTDRTLNKRSGSTSDSTSPDAAEAATDSVARQSTSDRIDRYRGCEQRAASCTRSPGPAYDIAISEYLERDVSGLR